MSDSELAARKSMTFEQAEGEPLPTQLQRDEVSKELRAVLWYAVHNSFEESLRSAEWSGRYVDEPWLTLLRMKHIFRDHRMADEFDTSAKTQTVQLKKIFTDGDYKEVFGFVQWLLRQRGTPAQLKKDIGTCLRGARSAYKIYDGDTLVPISSEEEAQAYKSALAASSEAAMAGPKTHLKNAGVELANGNWSGSIRESMHAVEACAKLIEPGARDLGPALTALEKKHPMHGGLRNGFASLYGFTSDEKGIRHALLEKGAADVDATDAQFMLGACAAFVSYLIARTREAP